MWVQWSALDIVLGFALLQNASVKFRRPIHDNCGDVILTPLHSQSTDATLQRQRRGVEEKHQSHAGLATWCCPATSKRLQTCLNNGSNGTSIHLLQSPPIGSHRERDDVCLDRGADVLESERGSCAQHVG